MNNILVPVVVVVAPFVVTFFSPIFSLLVFKTRLKVKVPPSSTSCPANARARARVRLRSSALLALSRSFTVIFSSLLSILGLF